MMTAPAPDPNNPQPTPDNPNPEPARPPVPPELPPRRDFPVPTASSTPVLAFALICGIVASGPMAAQTQERDPAITADPCQAQPDNPADADGEGKDQASDPARPKLEDCNGVLVPPKTGDQEIEEAPPDTGTTPVIPPERVPEQPPE